MLGLNYLAWVGIVSWIIVPLLALLATVLIWRRSQNALTKAVALAVGFAILFTPMLASNGVKVHYDQQVRDMCATDGGVRVYETVRLPAERFDKWGNVNVPNKRYAKLSDEYYSEFEDHYLRQGNPSLLRIRTWVVRQSDGKVLGDPTASIDSITNILKASGNQNALTLETALDNLRELVFGATVPGTVPEGRDSSYADLYQLTDWLTARSNSGTAPALKIDALAPSNAWRLAA